MFTYALDEYGDFEGLKNTNKPILIIPELSEPPVRTLGATIPENESHIFR